MAEQSAISWTDATFNPWIGCTKVSPGCDHCYAERDNNRRKWVEGWGTGVPRRRTKTWSEPVKWNRKAIETGYRPRVFCASLSDVFDNEVDQAWRNELWTLIEDTTCLRWMLLTKRIGNVDFMVPKSWISKWPQHVGLMATLVSQDEWDRDYWKLEMWKHHAPWIGVSVEPMLGPIDIGDAHPDWIITGGESGFGFRHTDISWVRSMRDQCKANGIAYHHKQWGGVHPKQNGCLIDCVEHKAFPPYLM